MTKVSGSKPNQSFWARAVEWGLRLLDSDSDVVETGPAQAEVPRHELPARKDATIARVRQVDETSCGVAAAAMFARQKHAVVKSFMFPDPKRKHFGTHYGDVWNALGHFGVEHEKKIRRFKGWNEIPSDALVKIRWNGAPPSRSLHWVIFQRLPKGFRVIDPASWEDTLAHIDFKSCKGLTFSLVTPRTREQGPLKLDGKKAPAKEKAPTPPKPKTPVKKPPTAKNKSPFRALTLGRTSVSGIREDEPRIDAIAEITGLQRGAVRNRAKNANGKTHVRVVFADRWPSRLDELGAEPCSAFLEDATLIEELGRLVGAKPALLKKELGASPRGTARNVLGALWPSAAALTRDTLLEMSVQQARGAGELVALAKLLGIDPGRFSRRLKSAHGAMLVKNAFADLIPESPVAPKPGFVLGRFELTGREWQGGFGLVREAFDRSHDPKRRVVLKWPHGNAQSIKVLEKEYESARDLRHRGLVGYFELRREDDESPVLVIEHGGMSLKEKLETTLFTIPEALALCKSVAQALDYLVEEHSLVHRDVHPGNILVDSKGVVKLTDFGISSHILGAPGNTQVTSSFFAHFPDFASPEVVKGKASRRSDQYSLALVFLVCIAGIAEAIASIERDELPDDLSNAQKEAFWRARSESPAKRFVSCGELVAALGGDLG